MSEALNVQNEVVGNSIPRVRPVDNLVPTKLKKYVEFATSLLEDYMFRVNDLSSLIQHEMELMGMEFPLPEFNFSAQIKCDVSYDKFQLSIRFLDPEKNGQPVDSRIQLMNIVTVIENQNKVHGDQKLDSEFPFQSKIVYGDFVPFCTLSYAKNLKDAYDHSENSITLHLEIGVVAAEDVLLDGGVLLWKVDVSRGQLTSDVEPNRVMELGLTPFFNVAPDGARVQIRLFVKNDGWCWFEVRKVNESDSRRSYAINFYVIHPTDPTRRLHTSFDSANKNPYSIPEPKNCFLKEFANKSALQSYFNDGKLLIKVEIRSCLSVLLLCQSPFNSFKLK